MAARSDPQTRRDRRRGARRDCLQRPVGCRNAVAAGDRRCVCGLDCHQGSGDERAGDGRAIGSPAASATPPEATLSVEGGDPVVGQLGTYTWADGGSDSPWLTGTPIKAATGEALTVNLDGGVGIAGWTVKRVVAGHEGGSGTTGLASGSGAPVTFAAPPIGSWSVQVTIQFAGDLGSASYYWRVDVK